MSSHTNSHTGRTAPRPKHIPATIAMAASSNLNNTGNTTPLRRPSRSSCPTQYRQQHIRSHTFAAANQKPLPVNQLESTSAALALSSSTCSGTHPPSVYYRFLQDGDNSVREIAALLEAAFPPGIDLPQEHIINTLSKYIVASGMPIQTTLASITFHQHDKYQVWQLHLRNMPRSTSTKMSQAGNSQSHWAHATSETGFLGTLLYGMVLPTCSETMSGRQTQGFCCAASTDDRLQSSFKK